MKIEITNRTQYPNSSELPSNDRLIEEYKMEYPFTQVENIKVYTYQNNTYVYAEIDSKPIQIDRHRLNCFFAKEEFEIEFTPRDKGARDAGYCKIIVEPTNTNNAVVIEKEFSKGEKYLESISRYKITQERLNGLELLYSQYIAQSILNFCDNYNIIETKFTIVDLIHDVIDTSPMKYGIFVKSYLRKAFREHKFRKVDNSA